MRVGILQIWQESNSFNSALTKKSDFRCGTGQAGLVEFGRGEEVAGFIRGLEEWGTEVKTVGLFFAQAWPGGPINRAVREYFAEILTETMNSAGKLDAVLFSLHGALAAVDDNDMDGTLLDQVRGTVGANVPIVATVDLHAHLTAKMARSADLVVAYHSNPHIDRCRTGRRAAGALRRMILGARPWLSAIRLPMIVPGELTGTDGAIMADVFQRLKEIETDKTVLSAAVLMTQPYMDVADLGWTTLVYTNDKLELGKAMTSELADMCWDRREKLRIDLPGAEECIETALQISGKPVVVSDGADATNSGACGDSVHLLAAMLKRDIPGGALTIMVDPEAVAHAKDIGVGGQFRFAVGGKRDNVFSRPLSVSGKVLSLGVVKYLLSGHLADNMSVDMGHSATVKVGDVTLLLVEKSGPSSSPMMYRCVGLEPKDYKIVVVKSPAGFRAEYGSFAAGIVLSCCPGCASANLRMLKYERISRPVWPLDDIEDRHEASWAENWNQDYED